MFLTKPELMVIDLTSGKKTYKLIIRIICVVAVCTALFIGLAAVLISNGGSRLSLFKKTVFTPRECSFEFRSEGRLYDLFDLTNGTVVSEDELLDTRALGDFSAEVIYRNPLGISKKKTVSYSVVDTVPPVMMCPKTVTMTQGSDYDIAMSVFSADNCDPNPERKIEGSYDINTVGKYPVRLVVTDASGNVTQSEFTISVVPKSDSSSSSSSPAPYYYFNDFVRDYASAGIQFGIDVSTWQGDIDWYAVKRSGVAFAMMRIGYQAGWGGESKTDGWFDSNIQESVAAGMEHLGVYFYSYALTEEEAVQQAKWVIEKLNGVPLDLGIAFDWESFSGFPSRGKSLADMNDIARAFLSEVEKAGYRGIMYGSLNYLNTVWDLPEYDTWLAHYAKQTSYQKRYRMWQLSSTGNVPGINGYCDLDILYNR
ncbi:MAG: glycoside hydrolase family 25 [Eubacteriales bacterium]|nr:glycoside hydrolase family 25 [Eubacteriales bacterium]